MSKRLRGKREIAAAESADEAALDVESDVDAPAVTRGKRRAAGPPLGSQDVPSDKKRKSGPSECGRCGDRFGYGA